MRIAFDAKRAFQNSTGLGNYSRVLISQLATDFPDNEYYLVAPKETDRYRPFGNMFVIGPVGICKLFKSAWRSNWVKKDLQRLSIDIYHGLSHEIPVGVEHTGIKTVVTMHDLIFERYPRHYGAADILIYRKKFKNACTHADSVIAISEQTKNDLVELYKVPADKISVCYQSCDPRFSILHSEQHKRIIRQKYKLPERYFLYVGSIIERKNLLTICKAIQALKDELPVPLVVIGGSDSKYALQVKKFIQDSGLQQHVIFLTDQPESKTADFQNSNDFPAIYQSAVAMIYPSLYEGFGLPVLEALWSRLPVITSNRSCLPEAGGDAAYYIDPLSVDEMRTAMLRLATDNALKETMKEKGLEHARKFSPELCAAKVMELYKRLVR